MEGSFWDRTAHTCSSEVVDRWPQSIKRDSDKIHTLLNYFLVMFPSIIPEICTWTCVNLDTEEPLTQVKLVKFIGLMVTMTLHPMLE